MKHFRFFITILVILLAVGPLVQASSLNMTSENMKAIEWYNKAVDAAGAGNFEESVNLTDQALSMQPNFTLAHITRAGALLELGRIDDAKLSIESALDLEPDDSGVLATAASYYLKTGKYREAVRYADLAVVRDPSLVEAWIIKGTSHGELGEFDEELNASKKALQVAPDNQKALSNLKYASDMMNKGKKSPIQAVSVLAALSCVVLLFTIRR